MRVRHKPPSLVSMWMLDVFCCALGCVTLLFLVNSRLATDAATASRAAHLELAQTDQKLAAALTSLDSTRVRLTAEEAERGRLAAALTDLEGARRKLADEAKDLADRLTLTRAEKDAAAKELAAARAALTDADRTLAARQKELDALAKKDEATAARLADLRRQVTAADADRDGLEAKLAAARKELADAAAKVRATQKELDAQLATAKDAAARAGGELATARSQARDLTKKMEELSASIIDLQGDKAKLADKFDKMQKETEARFAGIAMTGRRVVFLIDMSGSMGKRDLQTVDPTKWPLVIETACKVMRSIPTLEKYQVVVFSSAARWLFADGEWLEYEGERSVEKVRAALLKVKPVDDTNVYAALDKAFGLRPGGLDTVYLFSDGLPTSGPGLTAAQERANLSETELGAVLGKHVRDTLSRRWNRPVAGQPRVRVNAVGFYFESVEVGAFLWALARDNDGSFVGMSRP